METGKMNEGAIQSKSFLRKIKVRILNFFKPTKDYRFKSHMPFLSTNEGIDKLSDEIKRLESEGYLSSDKALEQLIQRTTYERNLVESRHEGLVNRARIYFSLVAIITIIALGIINSDILLTRIQEHVNLGTINRIIVLVSFGTLLYLILMSISTLSLVLRNYSSGFWNKHVNLFPAGLDLAKKLGKSGQEAIMIQQYIAAKAIEYSTRSTVKANIYWRNHLGDSTDRLVRAVILAIFLSLYLAAHSPELYVQIVYGSFLSIFLITTLIKDRIDVIYLITALYNPEKRTEREIELEERSNAWP